MSAAERAAPAVDLRAIVRNGAIAAVVSAVLNALVARIGAALFDVPDTYLPLQVVPVMAFTVFAVAVGTLIYALLSLLQPLSLLFTDNPQVEADAPATAGAVAVMAVLHLIPAAVIVPLLTRTGRSTAP